jgi:hypothetical protein
VPLEEAIMVLRQVLGSLLATAALVLALAAVARVVPIH